MTLVLMPGLSFFFTLQEAACVFFPEAHRHHTPSPPALQSLIVPSQHQSCLIVRSRLFAKTTKGQQPRPDLAECKRKRETLVISFQCHQESQSSAAELSRRQRWTKGCRRCQRRSAMFRNQVSGVVVACMPSTASRITSCRLLQYDQDVVTWSPQGRIHQIEYAMEAVKQGSAAVGLKVILCCS